MSYNPKYYEQAKNYRNACHYSDYHCPAIYTCPFDHTRNCRQVRFIDWYRVLKREAENNGCYISGKWYPN